MPKVFISYSHTDQAWAAKVADSLNQIGFEFFFDRASLRAGSNWEGQILQSLLECDHLVVLWSKQAQASDWVSRERARFEAAWQKLNEPLAPGHALVHLLLDNPRSAYDSYQHVSEILDAGAYAAGADAVPDTLWQQVVDRLAEALGQTSVPITTAILAATRTELEQGKVDFTWEPAGGRSLINLLSELGIKPEQLTTYYGATREEWRPFGGNQTIQQVLEGIKNQLNSVPTTAVRWVPIEEELFSNNRRRIDQAAVTLANTVSLIVIDPVALYSPTIRNLVQVDLATCFDNPQAVVAALPLFPTLPQPRTHEEMVKQVLRSLVDRFYGEFPGLNQALCSIFTPDDADIKRLVRTTIRYLAAHDAQAKNPYLGVRRR
jgi:TIR domain